MPLPDVVSKSERDKEWKFAQWFRKTPNSDALDANGEEPPPDTFDISAVRFDQSGEFLASGDNSGNVVVLRNDPERNKRKETVKYVFHCEFLSHFPEFDYVTSSPISERIHDLQWGPKTNDSMYLLNTSCKHIKLWKLTDREPVHYVNWNIDKTSLHQHHNPNIPFPSMTFSRESLQKKAENSFKGGELKVPKVVKTERCVITGLKKLYPYQSHVQPITHLAVTADMENFISADYFKINLWDLYRSDACYQIANFLPSDAAVPVKEVVTTLDRHPLYSHLFCFGTNLGKIKVVDMRSRGLAESAAKEFCSVKKKSMSSSNNNASDPMEQHSLFDEVTSGVASAKFSNGGHYIVSRDYMSVKIWDTRYEKKPLEVFYVHEYLREGMFELFRSQKISDAFSLGLSPKGDIVTGTYSNFFHLMELSKKRDVFVHASQEPQVISALNKHTRRREVQYLNGNGINGNGNNGNNRSGGGLRSKFPFNIFPSRSRNNNSSATTMSMNGNKNNNKDASNDVGANGEDYPLKMDFESIDFDKKVVDCAWHPTLDAVAVTAQNSLYVYSK